MKKAFRKLRFPALLLLSFWLVVLPARSYVISLDDSDFNPPYPCIQNLDGVDLTACLKNNGKILDSALFTKHFLFEEPSTFQISNPSFQHPLSPSGSTLLPLRC
jgi:hypothetical protein